MSSFPGVLSNLATAIHAPPQLRDYQLKLKADIYAAWQRGIGNVCAISPTGSGKTVTMASIASEHNGGGVLIAHRQELVAQISLALNSFGVRHRIIAPDSVRRLIISRHLKEHGKTFHDPGAMIAAAAVNTLDAIGKGSKLAQWKGYFDSVTLWVNDEAAHVTKDNLWGRVYQLFPNRSKGLGLTAWPGRGDGKGIGSHADGVFDELVIGPLMEQLIEQGYLTPFKIWTVPHSTDYDSLPVGASGELVQAKLVAAEDCDKALVGNIVDTYKKRVPGKRAICFVSSIKKAQETAEAFNAAGVPAMALDGKTDDAVRARAAEQLQSGELLVLVNADLFGEGTDIPAVEVVIMGTRTASFQRYLQWFGRMLRLSLSEEARRGYGALSPAERRARIAASDKPFGIVIDHAGNVVYHNGPPCGPHLHPTLDRREKRSSGPSDAIPFKVCVGAIDLTGITWEEARAAGLNDDELLASGMATELPYPCAVPYAGTNRCCPTCGYMPMPAGRSAPREVDGDLQLLDMEAMQALWNRALEARRTVGEYRDYLYGTGLSAIKVEHLAILHREKLGVHAELDRAMGDFGGIWHAAGETDSQIQRRFYHSFGIDVVSAQALSKADALKLIERIDKTVKGA